MRTNILMPNSDPSDKELRALMKEVLIQVKMEQSVLNRKIKESIHAEIIKVKKTFAL